MPFSFLLIAKDGACRVIRVKSIKAAGAEKSFECLFSHY